MQLSFTVACRVGILALSLAGVPLVHASAQKSTSARSADPDADVRAVYNYKLTEAGLRKYATAVRAISALANDPKVAAQLKAGDDGDVPTLADLAAHFDRVPRVKQAINGAGMTSLEFATFIMATLQASIAYAGMQAAGGKEAAIPPDISKANVDFVRTHQEELLRLQKEFAAAGKQHKSADPDTSDDSPR